MTKQQKSTALVAFVAAFVVALVIGFTLMHRGSGSSYTPFDAAAKHCGADVNSIKLLTVVPPPHGDGSSIYHFSISDPNSKNDGAWVWVDSNDSPGAVQCFPTK